MKLSEHIESLMRQGFSPDEIIRAAERANTGERIEERLDMVGFATRLCGIDESMIGGEPLMRRYGR
jgi:hypothetical protein